MKNVLLLCHDIPSMSVGATLPFYHLIKQLYSRYNLKLLCFDSGNVCIDEIKDYLTDYHTVSIPQYHSIKDQFFYTLQNMICTDNLKTRSFLNYYYHKNMNADIKHYLDDADLIITDMPMAFYVKNINIPKIVYAFDAVSNYNYNMYRKSQSITSNIYWYLNYRKIAYYEKCYDKFDRCIVVNKKDKFLLEKDLNVDIDVVANGVDTEYFTNRNPDDDIRLVFLGDMSTPPNNDAIRYFVSDIYPLVLKQKDIKLYIVGRNPSDYIKSLNNDNIIVTGQVDDVRDYLTTNSIFITPMISGTGIKNKILEAMSMNLAVISTSIGISGIEATNNKEYILCDTSDSFKDSIINLINDEKLRNILGSNARDFVYKNYSWIKSSQKIDSIIKNVLNYH